MIRLLVFGACLLACGSGPGGEANDSSCTEIAETRERDVCLYEQLLEISPQNSQRVVETTQKIQDPVIQSAGVLEGSGISPFP